VFGVLGLGTGAVYAVLALGLVVEHRVSGVVNVAHGAMAAWATYVFVELREAGDLVLPVVGIPGRIHVADRPPFAVCLVVALATGAALGVVVYGLVFRPLRSAPVLARVVASVGVLVALQALIVLRFGSGNRSVSAVLPASPVRLAGVTFPSDRLWLAGVAVVTAVVLWVVSRSTRAGLASRAVADDPATAAVLGCPVERLAAGGWVLASVLAALAGILVAPITSLNPVTYTLLVVPALAAALVGRLSSFGLTTVVALAIGVAQSEIVYAQGRLSWLPRADLGEALPFLVIVVVIAVAGRAVPTREERLARRQSDAGRPPSLVVTPVAAGALVAAAVALFTLGATERLALVTSLIGALICLSLVPLTGWVGEISLAQMAFAGVAGFTLSKLGAGLGIPFPAAPVLAAGAAAGIGLLLSLPALRVRGASLAVVTLAGAVAVEDLVFRNASLTGGFGGSTVPAPRVFGLDLGIGRGDAYPRPVFGLLVLAAVAAVAIGLAAVRRRPTGRRMLALRENERAAAAAGVDAARTRVGAFTASALVAGAGGAFLGYSQGRLSYGSFGVLVSLAFLAAAYVGGITTVSGALVGGALVGGGIVFTLLDHVAGWSRYQPLAVGIGVVVAAVCLPDGLAGAGRRLARRARGAAG
jgi:branched-chain amino acid transport system permease protein